MSKENPGRREYLFTLVYFIRHAKEIFGVKWRYSPEENSVPIFPWSRPFVILFKLEMQILSVGAFLRVSGDVCPGGVAISHLLELATLRRLFGEHTGIGLA